MNNVFIFTAADQTAQSNWQKTIINGYPINSILPFVNDPQKRTALEEAYPNGRCYLWGSRRGERNNITWQTMSKDDLVMGYYGWHIHCAAYVTVKMKNPQLAHRIWLDDGDPFELMYFLTRPTYCRKSIKSSDVFAEKYLGFAKMPDEKIYRLLACHKSFDNFIKDFLCSK